MAATIPAMSRISQALKMFFGNPKMTPMAVAPAPSATILVGGNGYDTSGNLASVTDPQGTVTQLSYDNLGRVTQQIENYGTGLLNKTTAYTYMFRIFLSS